MLFEEKCQFNTELTADVVQWQPNFNLSSPNENILACATYFLDKEQYKRKGIIYLLNFNEDNASISILDSKEYSESGILDMKWTNGNFIVSLDSDESLDLHQFSKASSKITSKNLFKIENQSKDKGSAIGLTFDFIDESNQSIGFSSIAVGNSKGKLRIIESDNETDVKPIVEFHAHDYEVWSVMFDKFQNKNILYSGADDCLLKLWDLRESYSKPTSQWSIFSGGVCSIVQPYGKAETSEFNDNHILCGSYDEKIYLLDRRNRKSAIKESKKLNGGVWKMSLNPNFIVAACMHTGLHIIDYETLQSLFYYEKHQLNNLVYGCDWKLSSSKFSTGALIASCSFYNHELRIWKLKY